MINNEELTILLEESAKMIKAAEAIAIFAGAGMSADSGIPTYRGRDGLWTKKITVNNVEVNNYDLMNPAAFKHQPELAWGLIGKLMELYENTTPHLGFNILKEFVFQKEYFIVTSNIDGQFQKAGFDSNKILEFHGSIFNSQCGEEIECGIWNTPEIKFNLDGITAASPIPVCPTCNCYCRPNVHLFDDDFFAPMNAAEQQFRYMDWGEKILTRCHNIIALEIGAGKTIPTIRRHAERFAGNEIPLIRINPFDFELKSSNHFLIPLGAKNSMTKIKELFEDDYPF